MRSIQIAIDGPSGAGKSTMAKLLSKRLGFRYLDTGAMYRALALKAIRMNIDPKDREKVVGLLPSLDIKIEYKNGNQVILLDGEDVSEKIRTEQVSMGASDVSAIPEVREKLVKMQQEIACDNNVVMDGRDIGTHVLPNAQIKIFLTASVEERAKRRYKELKEKGLLTRTYEELVKEIETRDYNDSHRSVSPLRKAEDAILLDTSNLSIEETVEEILKIIKMKGFDNVI